MNKISIESPTVFLKWLQYVRGQSGLYYLMTSMTENDIKEALSLEISQKMIRITCCMGQPFMESFLVALAHYINTPQVNQWLGNLIVESRVDKNTIYQAFLYDCNSYFREQNVSVVLFYVVGQINTFCNDDVLLLEHALQECNFSIIQIVAHGFNNNKTKDLITMTNMERLDNVHFSYKHLDRLNGQMAKIENGLVNAGIMYSIDRHLEVGDSIRLYEDEIAKSKLVIVIITNEYLHSIQCMHEIIGIVKNGNIDKRVICIAEFKEIFRNGDGLKAIKDYWVSEKSRKAEQIKDEPGGSKYVMREISDIDAIICGLDRVWTYLTDVLTGTIDDYSDNDGEKMVAHVKRLLDSDIEKVNVDDMSSVSDSTSNTFAPAPFKIIQYGEKSVYIEKNEGIININ